MCLQAPQRPAGIVHMGFSKHWQGNYWRGSYRIVALGSPQKLKLPLCMIIGLFLCTVTEQKNQQKKIGVMKDIMETVL